MLTILTLAAIALIVVLGKELFAPRTKLQPIKIKREERTHKRNIR
jgi:hypothetical protein